MSISHSNYLSWFCAALFRFKHQLSSLFSLGLCGCISLYLWLTLTLVSWAAPAANSNPFLSLEDLPAEFVVASEAEAESCQMAGEKSAFVLKQQSQLVELICVSSFSLAAVSPEPDQVDRVRQVYDAILQNPGALVEQAQSMGVEGVKTLSQLQDIGDVASGFSKTEPEIGQTDVVLFRRGDLINSALVRYQVGQEPLIPLKTVARKLDRRITELTTSTANSN
nr:MAG: hypothetical protein EDM05_13970 [Leptolyngbya sp. IPPAS B-1204]